MCAVMCAVARAVLLKVLLALLADSAVLADAVVLKGRAPTLHCCHGQCRSVGRDLYEVEGLNIEVVLTEHFLIINCRGASVLESPALPRAETSLRVSHVELMKCPPPASGSLADALAALNVTLEHTKPNAPGELHGTLTLHKLPHLPPLSPNHFSGLEHLDRLEIYGDESAHLGPKRGFLAPLKSLELLGIGNMVLPTGELAKLTPSLRKLVIGYVDGIEQLPVMPALESLWLIGWMALRPSSLTRCDSLRKLQLERLAVTALPDGWLANCPRLEVLIIKYASTLIDLTPKLLLGTSALKHLALTQGSLKMLPAGLLDYSPNLTTVQLNENRLRKFPRGIFGVAHRVQELDLSSNELESQAMNALAPLEELVVLNLANNSRLGDLCETNGHSLIHNSTKMRKLLLNGTSVSRICRDWREDMVHLETLDLSRTNVSKLSLKDLQFSRSVKSEVVILGTPVTMTRMTGEDVLFSNAKRASNVSVVLECDCRMFWLRRALDSDALSYVSELRCFDGRLLRDVLPEELECARPEECEAAVLPAACACAVRPSDHHGWLQVRVRCEGAALYSMPRVPTDNKRLYELMLAHNQITHLHDDEVQPNINGLDLRNNSLRLVDEETARRVGNISGTVRLAANPLDCSCRAAPLLRALHTRNAARTDLDNITCSDGSPVDAALIVDCSPLASPGTPLSTWLAGVLAVLFALALAAAVFLASRERRFFALAVLHRYGIQWRAAEPEDDRRYDAFVTFSHKDEAVVYELLARLEPTYRLCIHHRDWVPGCFIAEQVVESVHESRRTLALVSRHYLASAWACAEFREAHTAAMLDARPRLIVVLLEEPAALEMDEQLRRYVATQTYLSWGEPWFWDKLAVALPRPRPPPPASTPPPSPRALPVLPALEFSPAPV